VSGNWKSTMEKDLAATPMTASILTASATARRRMSQQSDRGTSPSDLLQDLQVMQIGDDPGAAAARGPTRRGRRVGNRVRPSIAKLKRGKAAHRAGDTTR
jgi:hypothetical protein